MTPAKQGSYRFRRESIAEMRQRLGLSQSAMASMLDLPKNTVSRWERGETTPDAESLAAVYSLGKDKGVAAEFFVPVKQKTMARDAALVYWDMQSLAPASVDVVDRLDSSIKAAVGQRVPRAARRLFKAFSHNAHSAMTDRLEKLGWRVWEDDVDWTEDIYEQALSDAGQDPSGAVVFLVAPDESREELIQELRDRNVRVYTATPRGYGVQSNAIGPVMSTAALAAMAAEGKRLALASGSPFSKPRPTMAMDRAQEISVEVKRR